MRSAVTRLCALGLILAACTVAPEVTTTTATSLSAISTTTSIADRCPDVFCVVFRIDPQAVWSDGTPVTGADFEHTLREARADPAADPGYDLVTGIESAGDEVEIAFSEQTGAFARLFRPVLPAHDRGVTSGGFRLDGERLVSDAATVELVSVDGVRGAVTALARGEVDLVWLADPPAWAVGELSELDGMTVVAGPGPDWEMLTFNQANPLLAEEWVRRALAMGLDREAMADATVRTVDPDAPLLDTTLPTFGNAPYPIAHDPDGARALLGANGCEPASDGIWVCDGHRMSFDLVTTTGDQWRSAVAGMVAASLEAIGVEVTVTTKLAAELFGADFLFGQEWDLAAFAWEAQNDPVAAADLYRCRGDGPHGFGALNVGRHCGDDSLLDAAAASLDSGQRVELMRQVDRDFLAAAAVVPLFSRPIVAAWAGGVHGVAPGPFAGPLDAAGEWTGTTRLALPTPLESLRTLLLRGAFIAAPGGEYLPDLVIEYETIGG